MSDDILIVNPWIHDFAAYDLWAKPIGLLYIGSFLRSFGYNVRFVDLLGRLDPHVPGKTRRYGTGKYHAEAISKPAVYRDFPRTYKRHGITPDAATGLVSSIPSPKLILVTSVMTYWYPGVFETIEFLHDSFGDVPIVLGGIYATLCYDHARAHSGADIVVSGDGTLESLRIADDICGHHRDYGAIPTGPSDLPLPGYDLYDRLDSVSVLTSRGCPFSCTFCASNLLCGGFEQRRPMDVADEIEQHVVSLAIHDVAFLDDALLVRFDDHLGAILREVERKGLDVRFHTPNGLHVRYITDDAASALHRADFRTLRLSFETATDLRQRDWSFKTSRDEFASAVESLRAAGYSPNEIEVYLMVGMPDDDVAEVEDSMRFVNRCGARIKLAEFSPVPGTEGYKNVLDLLNVAELDPLMHNPSILPMAREGFDLETLKNLKSLAKTLNADLSA
jgi:radical SAM superfamily enzyme YgiQ (UPF0313 family)